ncbi:uncharacterized protein LOC143363406 [Halictus rubicundus]|uniref:uncharacterized protein LOC143363406 n=1 Tax=Halictus rubicundus TaxID=77578 RepID=UPI004036C216
MTTSPAYSYAPVAIHISNIGEPTSSWQQADRRRSQHPSTVVGDTSSGRSTNTGDLSSSLLILQDQGTRNETRKKSSARVLQEDEKARRFLTDKDITWHFIPALSPNFGGLWEAAVKSFKHHLKRVVGEELFTLEQFNTFVTEIEAILNSRPLTPLSSDPNDPSALTPGHLLIGSALTSLPEVDFTETSTNRLSKWQHIQKVKQDFWIRWSKEYIHHLNVRAKWTRGEHSIQVGTIVVLKDDHLPPMSWSLGRVEEIHPGRDGITRAVSVKTINGIYKRNVKQIAPLPLD